MAGLREQIGSRLLRKSRKGFQRRVSVQNFDTARSAVILFDAGRPESFQPIREFTQFLMENGIDAHAFGYVPQKEIPDEMLFREHFEFITRSDLNWYRKPAGEAASRFYSLTPDLLVDFTTGDMLELKFLVELSPARFKIGIYTELENDYDLMIQLKDPYDTRFFAEQIKHYVAMLNPVN